MKDELEEMQRPRVEAWCEAQNQYQRNLGKFGRRISNPRKIGMRWYADSASGTILIPHSAYKPPFPGTEG